MGDLSESLYRLRRKLNLEGDMGLEYPARPEWIVESACKRLATQDELRAALVDLLGFMDREIPGSEGYFYEIKRRAEYIRTICGPDLVTRLREERS